MAVINGHNVFHSILVVEGGSAYTPVALLDTTLTEETATIEITSYNSQPFNCKTFHIQLDIPAASTATNIAASVKRASGTYQGINSQNASLKTVTDSTKHTLVAFDFEQHGSVYFVSRYGAQQAANNVTWNNSYNNVSQFVLSVDASSFDADGTKGIKLTGLFPVGTIVKVWGEIKQ